jgi:hypothetical protein
MPNGTANPIRAGTSEMEKAVPLGIVDERAPLTTVIRRAPNGAPDGKPDNSGVMNSSGECRIGD